MLGEGWFRHFFYDLGNDSALAFFELHDVGEPSLRQPWQCRADSDPSVEMEAAPR